MIYILGSNRVNADPGAVSPSVIVCVGAEWFALQRWGGAWFVRAGGVETEYADHSAAADAFRIAYLAALVRQMGARLP